MKSIGRNNFCFYANEINKRSKKQFRLEAELHRAVELGEFILNYQPKIDLKTGTVLGLEALLRWQHPQLGIVPPCEFIPLAEQMGIIDDISQWVIHTVCRQIHFWREAGYDTITAAVNLSPLEFRNPELADKIIALTDEFGIPKSALELEITESITMQDMDAAVVTLEKLSNSGICISIDDFGVGYSSLSYLRRFPISKVKIDRSFISGFMQGSGDAAIVSAIIAMSHSLSLKVVAEGVETKEQLRFLQDLHCDEMQGFLVSRPLPQEEINDFLAQSSGIRHMILDYGVNLLGLMGRQDVGSASGMIGILNDYPARSVGPPIDGNKLEAGN
ncbi:MAG: EAL domain-containing protein [Gammaproteobacteria bacterium]|nr:EAL domain-containing protein [Gammaproteobacteria bacterium]